MNSKKRNEKWFNILQKKNEKTIAFTIFFLHLPTRRHCWRHDVWNCSRQWDIRERSERELTLKRYLIWRTTRKVSEKIFAAMLADLPNWFVPNAVCFKIRRYIKKTPAFRSRECKVIKIKTLSFLTLNSFAWQCNHSVKKTIFLLLF